MLLIRNSIEVLSLCCQTAWSDGASIIDNTHSLMTLVAWHLYWVVLNDVLFDKGCSHLFAFTLLNCLLVDISLRQEATVARNMAGNLIGSHS
jgi:hypothetical protein